MGLDRILVGMAAVLAALPAGAQGFLQGVAQGAADPREWKTVWQDEFEGDAIDAGNWVFDLGGGGWGNGESEFYTSRSENARVQDGCLIIEARREKYQSSYYTSARLKTQGLRAFRYGRIEARIKVPAGKGLWPAFWLLGADIAERGWPACGEIDVMEHIGKEPDLVLGTLHGPGYSAARGPTKRHRLPKNVAEDFHVFALEWEEKGFRWLCDGVEYFAFARKDLGGEEWVFDKPFFIVLNLAVGGGLPGPVSLDTPFPAMLFVDYVRVLEKNR